VGSKTKQKNVTTIVFLNVPFQNYQKLKRKQKTCIHKETSIQLSKLFGKGFSFISFFPSFIFQRLDLVV
jgi:hypothetical protein